MFYKSRGLPNPKDQTGAEDEANGAGEEAIRGQDYHRLDEQVSRRYVCFGTATLLTAAGESWGIGGFGVENCGRGKKGVQEVDAGAWRVQEVDAGAWRFLKYGGGAEGGSCCYFSVLPLGGGVCSI